VLNIVSTLRMYSRLRGEKPFIAGKVLTDPGPVESIAARELFPTTSSGADFAAVIRNEVARMTRMKKVAVIANIHLD